MAKGVCVLFTFEMKTADFGYKYRKCLNKTKQNA